MSRECEQLHPLLSLYLEEELSAKDKLKLARHLNECAAARRDLEIYRAQRRALLSFPEPEPPADLHERILAHVLGHGEASTSPTVLKAWWARPRTLGLAAAALGAVFFLNLLNDWNHVVRTAKAPMTQSTGAAVDEKKSFAPETSVAEAPAPPAPAAPRAEAAPAARREVAQAPKREAAKSVQLALGPRPVQRVNPNLHSVSAGADASEDTRESEALSLNNAPAASAGMAKESARSAAAPAALDSDNSAGRWSGNQGPYGQPHAEVLQDPTSFMAYWQILAPGEPMPPVDFNRQSVALIFLGTRPSVGYAIQVEGVQESQEAVTLIWREQAPAADALAGQALTRPWAMQIIHKTAKPVLFLKQP